MEGGWGGGGVGVERYWTHLVCWFFSGGGKTGERTKVEKEIELRLWRLDKLLMTRLGVWEACISGTDRLPACSSHADVAAVSAWLCLALSDSATPL